MGLSTMCGLPDLLLGPSCRSVIHNLQNRMANTMVLDLGLPNSQLRNNERNLINQFNLHAFVRVDLSIQLCRFRIASELLAKSSILEPRREVDRVPLLPGHQPR